MAKVNNMAQQTFAAVNYAEMERRAFGVILTEMERQGLKSGVKFRLHDEVAFEIEHDEVEQVQAILIENGFEYPAFLIGQGVQNG